MVGMPAAHAADDGNSTGVQPGTEVPEDTDNQGGVQPGTETPEETEDQGEGQPGTDIADETPDTDDGDSAGVQPGTEVPEDTDNQGGVQPGTETPEESDDDQGEGGVQPGTDTPVEQPETPEPAPTEPSQPDTTAPTTPPVVEQPQQPADESEVDTPRDNATQPSAPAAPAAAETSPASQNQPAPAKGSTEQGQSGDEVLGQIIAKAQAGNVSAEVTSTTHPYRTVTQAGVSVGAADYTLPVVSAGTYDPEAGTVSYGVGTPEPVEHKLSAPAATAAKAVHDTTRDWPAPQLPNGTYTVGDDSLGASLEVS